MDYLNIEEVENTKWESELLGKKKLSAKSPRD
jgi:hypothetical protein